jgi:hypothetical protein
MGKVAIWHGRAADLRRLERAVNVECTCARGDAQPCPAPHALLTDQKILDHMVFVIQHVTDYRRAEHNV